MAIISAPNAKAAPTIHRTVARWSAAMRSICRSIRSNRASVASRKPWICASVASRRPWICASVALAEPADFRGQNLDVSLRRFPEPADFGRGRLAEAVDFRGQDLDIGLRRVFDLPTRLLLYGPAHARHRNLPSFRSQRKPLPDLRPARAELRSGRGPPAAGVRSRGSAARPPRPSALPGSERAGGPARPPPDAVRHRAARDQPPSAPPSGCARGRSDGSRRRMHGPPPRRLPGDRRPAA